MPFAPASLARCQTNIFQIARHAPADPGVHCFLLMLPPEPLLQARFCAIQVPLTNRARLISLVQNEVDHGVRHHRPRVVFTNNSEHQIILVPHVRIPRFCVLLHVPKLRALLPRYVVLAKLQLRVVLNV